ncbi:MAG: hypothetical protein Q8J76_09355, partial [Desulfobulbaceae bacterium]|nr:hypothetical protein [Desulfobulbaceae bacterium]
MSRIPLPIFLITLIASVSLLVPNAIATTTISLVNGWNLKSSRIPITDMVTTFFDNQMLASIWAWDASTNDGSGKWKVFLPGEAVVDSYANSKGFGNLTGIQPGEGFWINSKADQSLTIFGDETTGNSIALNGGWNLKGLTSAAPVNVADVFNDISKFTSVWKWTGSTWSVFIPEETLSGSYAASKNFQHLTTLSSGEGFWVNTKYAGSYSLPPAVNVYFSIPNNSGVSIGKWGAEISGT